MDNYYHKIQLIRLVPRAVTTIIAVVALVFTVSFAVFG